MTTRLRDLFQDIAAQAKPVELAGPALRKARRIRTRRYTVGTAIVVVAVLGLSFWLVPRADQGAPQLAPPASPTPSGTTPAAQPSALPPPSIPARPVPSVQSPPVELPGGWIIGGGQGADQPWIYDRVQRRYRSVPYYRAIPAPVGDLVFVEHQDGRAGIWNLRKNEVRWVAGAGSGWTLGVPEWSGDGRRLLRITDQGRIYVTDAETGTSQEIRPVGNSCELCNSAVWLPRENQIALYDSNNPNGQTDIYDVASGNKMDTVPWKPGARTAFSPDGTRVFTRAGIFVLATGKVLVPVPEINDDRTVYWTDDYAILIIVQGGVEVISHVGRKVDFFPWPAEFNDDELPNFSLVKVNG